MPHMEDGARRDQPDTFCNQASPAGDNGIAEPIYALERLGERYSRESSEHRTIKGAVEFCHNLSREAADLRYRCRFAEGEATRLAHRIELAQTALGSAA